MIQRFLWGALVCAVAAGGLGRLVQAGAPTTGAAAPASGSAATPLRAAKANPPTADSTPAGARPGDAALTDAGKIDAAATEAGKSDAANIDTGKIDTGDHAWMLVSAALVLFMTAPGLALFYSGLVRKKNVLS
ncbi:MAG TPA: hypothetical protein VFE24_01965, partial [Pirellulales bacterium]|nr:hypothetical protein [Pirellulales bacterium]